MALAGLALGQLPRHRDEARCAALAAQSADPYALSATAVAEQRIPRPATATHGLLAALTTLRRHLRSAHARSLVPLRADRARRAPVRQTHPVGWRGAG